MGTHLGRAIVTSGAFNGVHVRQRSDAVLFPSNFVQTCYSVGEGSGADVCLVVDKKVTPKRRRSSAAGDVSPPVSGAPTTTGGAASAVKSKPGTAGVSGCQTPRMTVPLSERQQLALLMQMTADEQPTSG